MVCPSKSYYRPQRSWGKVIFSQASVILFTGGKYLGRYPPDQVHPTGTRYTPPPQTRYTPLGSGTSPGPGTPPWTRYTPQDQVPPWTRYTPSGTRYPFDQVPPRTRYPPEIRATGGRYASYWNAFLLQKMTLITQQWRVLRRVSNSLHFHVVLSKILPNNRFKLD